MKALGFLVLEMALGSSGLAQLPLTETLIPVLPSGTNADLAEFVMTCFIDGLVMIIVQVQVICYFLLFARSTSALVDKVGIVRETLLCIHM